VIETTHCAKASQAAYEGSIPFVRSNLRAAQVGYSRLGHHKLPISGKPEIGGATVGTPASIAKIAAPKLRSNKGG